MYYYLDILQRRGQFGILWLAAFEHAEFKKRSTVALVKSHDVDKSCEDILRYAIEGRQNCPRMNLYVTSTLLGGLCKVFRKKAELTFDDAARVFVRWGEVARLMRVLDAKEMKRFKRMEVKDIIEDSVNRPIIDSRQPPKKKMKTVLNEYDLPVLTHEELANILEQADGIRVADPSEITIEDAEVQEAVECGMDVLEEGFGGVESLLPELQDILNGVEPSTVPTAVFPEVTPMIFNPLNASGPIYRPTLDVRKLPQADLLPQTAPEEPLQLATEEPQLAPEQLPRTAPEEPLQLATEEPQLAPEQLPRTAPEEPLQLATEEPQLAPEQLPRTAPEEPLQLATEEPPQLAPEAELQHQETQTAATIAAPPRRNMRRFKKDKKIHCNGSNPIGQTLLHLKTLRDSKWEKQGRKKDEADLAVSHVMTVFPAPDGPAPDVPDIHRKVWPWMKRSDMEERRSLMRRSLSETHVSNVSIGSPTPVAERSQRGVSPRSPTFQETEVPERLTTIPEVIPHGEDVEPVVQGPNQDLSTLLEKEVAAKRKRSSLPEVAPNAEDVEPIVQDLSTLLEGEVAAKRRREEDDVSPSESVKSSTTSLRLEENLLSKIKGAAAEYGDMVTFAMIAPPASSTKLRAARLFTSLLNLEAKQLVETKQSEPFGDIFINFKPRSPYEQ